MNVLKLLKKETQFLSLTSLYPSEFEELLTYFSTRWYKYHKHFDFHGKRRSKPLTIKQSNRATKTLSSMEDKLYFILYFFKNNHLQQSLAAQFDMNQGQVSRWIKILMPLLEQCIVDLHLQAAQTMDELVRLFRNRQKINNAARHEAAQSLHVDASEREQGRNIDQAAQKHDYSGKKGTHTLKNTVLCDEFQFIHFTGFTHRGAISDKAMVEDELPDFEALRGFSLFFSKDKGYQAYDPKGVFLLSPFKASRNHPLTGEQELVNSWISSIRIVCEHAIAGVKRCRIVKEKIRYFCSAFRDKVWRIACGLHNFRVTRRNVAYANSASLTRARINLDFFDT